MPNPNSTLKFDAEYPSAFVHFTTEDGFMKGQVARTNVSIARGPQTGSTRLWGSTSAVAIVARSTWPKKPLGSPSSLGQPLWRRLSASKGQTPRIKEPRFT